ncbi:hypothetical protein [uncultured Duncaniella sp.]|uniref:hypothetical protein n=1 Tax=uncultured Duncaniella sp. TaxID=2768039 RepID=UPI002629131A|nr:hypothetical protein [uncultured Duncaniella sp.]
MRQGADLSQLIYGQDYIRYDTMYGMTMHAFNGTPEGNSDFVNVFVDVNSMLRFMYSNIPYQMQDYTCITASMVNLCAHIKSYFWSRHMTFAKVFLVYGDNNPAGMMPGYNGHYLTAVEAKKELQPIVEASMDLLNILMPYVNECYFVRATNVETAAIIYDMIEILASTGGPNIIYTKDSFDYQLVALCPRTFIYRPKKSNSMDVSWDVTKTTLIEKYRHEHGLVHRPDLNGGIPYYMLPFIMAMSGLRSRDILGTRNITDAMKTIMGSTRDTRADNLGSMLILGESSLEFWGSLGITNPDTAQVCMKNLVTLNVLTHVRLLRSSNYKHIYQNVVNLYDPDGFKEINNKYFIHYPLDVERL